VLKTASALLLLHREIQVVVPNVERIGLAADWRKGLQVMFRLRGAERPG
jgi:hypothetical protein